MAQPNTRGLSALAQADQNDFEHAPGAPYDDDPLLLPSDEDDEEESSGEDVPQDVEFQRNAIQAHPPQEKASRAGKTPVSRSGLAGRKRQRHSSDKTIQMESLSPELDEEHDPAEELNSLFCELEVPIKERILLCRGYASYLAAGQRSITRRNQVRFSKNELE